jgi:predicted metal-dependent RNase
MEPLTRSVKQVFLVHGEYPQQQALAAVIRDRYNLEVVIPDRGDSFTL